MQEARAGYFMKVYKAKPDDSLWQREVFSKYFNKLLRSKGQSRDPQGLVKQGYFENYYQDTATLLSAGYYENNEKTGEWKLFHKAGAKEAVYHYANGKFVGSNTSWYQDGKINDSFTLDEKGNGPALAYYSDGGIKMQGNYTEGVKKGKWEYFYKAAPHSKSIEVIFEKDSATSYTCYKENGDMQTKDCVYEREADFKKGLEGWKNYLVSRLEKFDTYKYLGPRKKYTAIVKFMVTTEGKTSEIIVENPGIRELDQFAIDVIARSPEWTPAVQYNQKVNAYRRQPISFVTD